MVVRTEVFSSDNVGTKNRLFRRMETPCLNVKTGLMAGQMGENHDEALVRAAVRRKTPGLKVKTSIKAGQMMENRNETLVRGAVIKDVKSKEWRSQPAIARASSASLCEFRDLASGPSGSDYRWRTGHHR
jgi:hypothetical protein